MLSGSHVFRRYNNGPSQRSKSCRNLAEDQTVNFKLGCQKKRRKLILTAKAFEYEFSGFERGCQNAQRHLTALPHRLIYRKRLHAVLYPMSVIRVKFVVLFVLSFSCLPGSIGVGETGVLGS